MTRNIAEALETRFRQERARAQLVKIGRVVGVDYSSDRKVYTVSTGSESVRVLMLDWGFEIAEGKEVIYIPGNPAICLGPIEMS